MENALENILSTYYKNEMLLFMDSHPEYFDNAIELAISDKQPYAWRAAWLLSSCMKENDERIQANIDKIINSLVSKEDGHQRELIKILLRMELKDEHEGYLFDICVTLWEKINKKPSVRYIAFKFIVKTAKKYPELSNEITFLTQNQYLDSLSPGIKRSISKMIKELTNEIRQ